MNILLLLTAILLIYISGFLAYVFLGHFFNKLSDLNFFLRIATYWTFGLGAISLQLLLLSWLKLGWNLWLLDLPWILLLVAYLYRHKIKKPAFDLGLLLSFVLLIFITVHLTFSTLSVPVWDWDGWGIWNFKAQAFFLEGRIPLAFLSDPVLKAYSHMDYPLLLPLSQVWIYRHLGYINTELSKIIFPLSYFSLLCFFLGGLYQYYKKIGMPLLLTISLALIPSLILQSQTNYADLILAMFLSGGLIMAFLWIEEKDIGYLLVSFLLLALSAWTKNEGLLIYCYTSLAILVVLLFQRRKKQIGQLLAISIISSLLWLPWYIYTRHFHLSSENWFSNINYIFIKSNLWRFSVIIKSLYNLLLNKNMWGWFWLIFVATFLMNISKKSKDLIYYLFIIGWIALYVLMYFFTVYDLSWHLDRSLDRLTIHFLPISAFLVSITLIKLWIVKKYEKV